MEELGRMTNESFQGAQKLAVIIVLDEVRSMSNVGSVFRSADAFAAEAIYLCGLTPQPPHRDIHKTALGATETIPWKHFHTTREAIIELQRMGYEIVAIEQTHGSISLEQFQPQTEKKYAIVFGHEVFGVQDEVLSLSNLALEIPQAGTKHSLNIAVSAGIILWKFAEPLFLKSQGTSYIRNT